MNAQTKSDGIEALVAALGPERRGWLVVDHWNDTCAIAFAVRTDRKRLVYVNTLCASLDRYDFECELADPSGEAPYIVTSRGTDVTFAELTAVLERHLRI